MRLQSDTSEGQQDTKKPVHFQNHLSCTERSIHTTLESSKTSMLKKSRNKQKDTVTYVTYLPSMSPEYLRIEQS